jgi:zinc protease
MKGFSDKGISMEPNNTGFSYIPQNNIIYRDNRPSAVSIPVQMPVQPPMLTVPSPYQYQHYQYPAYSAVNQTADINASMKSQMMPASTGYKEIQTFDVPFLDKGKLYKLDNGQNVVIIPKKGPTTIKTFVKVGSFNEAKNRGISHYIEHNLFNGSSQLTPNEFVEKVVNMGGQYNASTNTVATDYFIKSPMHKDDDFEKFMGMHADMIQNPTFTQPTLEKERGPVISEIQMYEDDPSDKSYNLMLKNLFGIKADYQGLIAGSSKNIANVTRQDVVDYYNEWYKPDNMTTVIVGEVNPDEVIKTTSKLFNKKKAPSINSAQHYYEPLIHTQSPVRSDIKSPHVIDAVNVTMGFAGPQNNDIKDSAATMALCTALTGFENARLTQTLKKFDTTGGAGVDIINPRPTDPQIITFGTTFIPGKEEEGLKAVYSTMQTMATQPISAQEMDIVKNKLKDTFAQLSENSMNVANMVAEAMHGHGDLNAYTNILNEVDNLTPQDIQRAAQKYLDLNKVSIVMVHPENKHEYQSAQKIGFGASKQASKLGFSSNNDRFKLQNIKEYDLPNNLHISINDDPQSIRTSANLAAIVDNPPTLKPGVVEVLNFMLNKGTKNLPEEQLNNIIDSNNLGISANASYTGISLTSDCSKEKLPMALGIMKEIFYNADLSPEKFEKAKEELKVSLSSEQKDPTDKALEALYPDNQIGITSKKVLDNLNNVTLQDVQALHSHIVNNSQGRMVIDGPISKTPNLGQQIFAQLQSNISFAQPYHPTTALNSKPLEQTQVITETETRNQADIVQMFKIKSSKNIKDEAALTVLNQILGGNSNSRLFTDLRESQKLAYKVKSIYANNGDYGYMKLLIKTTTEDDLKGPTHENIQKSLDGFKKHTNSLITTPVDEKELETAKVQAKTKLIEPIETSIGRTAAISTGQNSLYGATYHNDLLDTIDSLTPKDIQNAAKLYLSKPSVVSLIASPSTIKDMQPYLDSLKNDDNAKTANQATA